MMIQRWQGGCCCCCEGLAFHHTPLKETRRSIRSIIPPRPVVTTIAYLNSMGGRVTSAQKESSLSLIRTRDNKFWLQRVMPSGEVIRWRALGLDRLKYATNFEQHSINDIDDYGGIVVPRDVIPQAAGEVPAFIDAVQYMMNIQCNEKLTRKVRRQWHRRLFSHWKESPEKYLSESLNIYVFPFLVFLWFTNRLYHSITNEKSFFAADVYVPKGAAPQVRRSALDQAKRFTDMHPEHEGFDAYKPVMMSPAMDRLSTARAELRESDVTDPHFHSELWWKIRHCRYYGHWPKSLTA